MYIMIDCRELLGETPMTPNPPKVWLVVELLKNPLEELAEELVDVVLVAAVPVALVPLDVSVELDELDEPKSDDEDEELAAEPASDEEAPASGWPKKPSVCVLFWPRWISFQSSLPVIGSRYLLRRKRMSLVLTSASSVGG